MNQDSGLAAASRLRAAVPIFVMLCLVWLALNGREDMALGVLVAALAAAVAAWLAPPSPGVLRLRFLPLFSAYFLVESVRGALDVAGRAFQPSMPLDLQLVSYPIRLPAGKPRTLLIAVVSLLPGTLSAALRAADNRLLIHALTGDPIPAVRALERQIARLFGIDLIERD